MIINNNMKVAEVKDLFAELFSSLKIEFYKKSHTDHRGSAREEQLSDDMMMSELIGNTASVLISINPSMTVTELESAFELNGLHVQVFRWSNDLWLQTISSDHLTLQEQNQRGQQSIRN